MRLRELTLEDAEAEGFATPAEFLASYAEINKIAETKTLRDTEVWVIDFRLSE